MSTVQQDSLEVLILPAPVTPPFRPHPLVFPPADSLAGGHSEAAVAEERLSRRLAPAEVLRAYGDKTLRVPANER